MQVNHFYDDLFNLFLSKACLRIRKRLGRESDFRCVPWKISFFHDNKLWALGKKKKKKVPYYVAVIYEQSPWGPGAHSTTTSISQDHAFGKAHRITNENECRCTNFKKNFFLVVNYWIENWGERLHHHLLTTRIIFLSSSASSFAFSLSLFSLLIILIQSFRTFVSLVLFFMNSMGQRWSFFQVKDRAFVYRLFTQNAN